MWLLFVYQKTIMSVVRVLLEKGDMGRENSFQTLGLAIELVKQRSNNYYYYLFIHLFIHRKLELEFILFSYLNQFLKTEKKSFDLFLIANLLSILRSFQNMLAQKCFQKLL